VKCLHAIGPFTLSFFMLFLFGYSHIKREALWGLDLQASTPNPKLSAFHIPPSRSTHFSGDSPLGTRRGLLVLRGTLGYGSITCFFLACQLLPLADATTFTFLAPLVVVGLSPLILDELPGVATVFLIPVCITGVLLITQPKFLFGGAGGHLNGVGVMFGMLQPIFSASAKVWVAFALSSSHTCPLSHFALLSRPYRHGLPLPICLLEAPRRCLRLCFGSWIC
jgi:drug/metabolite transporter (DMT)-like permease